MTIDKKENSVCLFGGSFDPVTNAHVAVVDGLVARFDHVVVVPSFVSPFKKLGSSADASKRLEMLEAVFGFSDKIAVSDFEIVKEGISFTIDTVRHFAKEFADKDLYFCMGSEMLKKLTKWHEFDSLKDLVTFFIVERKGYEVPKALFNRLTKKLGAKLEIADFTAGEDSSSAVRVDIAFDVFDNIPKAAASVIKRDELYGDFNYIVEAYSRFGLSPSRIEHIYGTAQLATELSKKHNASAVDLVTAALLHDIAKEASNKVLADAGADLGAQADVADKVRHAFLGADIAKSYFGIKKRAILDAIRFHTSGSPKMGKLAKLLFIADFCEAGRDGERYAQERAEVLAEKKLNKAVLKILETKIKHVEGRGKEVFGLTYDAYAFYVAACAPKIAACSMVNDAIEGDVALKALFDDADKVADVPVQVEFKEEFLFEACAAKKLAVPMSMPAKAEVCAIEPDKAAEGADEGVSAHTEKPKKQMVMDKGHLAYRIAKILDDKKGRDITIIDLSEKTIIADYFVIASAFSTTAVRALTDIVDEELSKKMGIEPLRRDIDPTWAAIDYGSVILHVQLEETRDFYNLERLWSDGSNSFGV